MIDPALVVSPAGALLFHLKQGFWLYGWPVMIGFLTILGYQALSRIVLLGSAKWPAIFVVASIVSMISLFGWATMVRGMEMIPFYGCGVGLASVLMSRVYAVTSLRHPRLKIRTMRIIWRGDTAGVEQFQKAMRERAGAQPGLGSGSVGAARAGV